MSVAAPPLFGDPVPATAAPLPERALASFWRRLGAFVIDSIIVGLAAFVLGIPFFDSFVQAGAIWTPRRHNFGVPVLRHSE